MIPTKWIKKRWVRIVFILSLFPVVAYLATLMDGAYEIYKPQRNDLLLVKNLNFPIRELGGMSLMENDLGEHKVYFIGEHNAELGEVTFNFDGLMLENGKILELGALIKDRFALCSSPEIHACKKLAKELTSKWQAVQRDYRDNVYLLHEEFSSIVVFNLPTQSLSGVINLSNMENSANPLRNKSTHNAHHEEAVTSGFVLLKNQHLLVTKEKSKPAIFEFGPSGDEAHGYNPSLRLTKEDSSIAVSGTSQGGHVEMEPLRYWKLPKKERHCHVSEINYDRSGNLFIMSNNCNWLAQVAELRPDEGEIKFIQRWNFPKHFKNGEAFAVLDDKYLIIGEDRNSKKNANLHLMQFPEPLMAPKLTEQTAYMGL